MDMRDEIAFAKQVTEDSRRVLLVRPEDFLAGLMMAAGNPLVTVQVNQWLPPATAVMVDPNALEASWRETLQQSSREFMFNRPPLLPPNLTKPRPPIGDGE